jgi:hypothetical protein
MSRDASGYDGFGPSDVWGKGFSVVCVQFCHVISVWMYLPSSVCALGLVLPYSVSYVDEVRIACITATKLPFVLEGLKSPVKWWAFRRSSSWRLSPPTDPGICPCRSPPRSGPTQTIKAMLQGPKPAAYICAVMACLMPIRQPEDLRRSVPEFRRERTSSKA